MKRRLHNQLTPALSAQPSEPWQFPAAAVDPPAAALAAALEPAADMPAVAELVPAAPTPAVVVDIVGIVGIVGFAGVVLMLGIVADPAGVEEPDPAAPGACGITLVLALMLPGRPALPNPLAPALSDISLSPPHAAASRHRPNPKHEISRDVRHMSRAGWGTGAA